MASVINRAAGTVQEKYNSIVERTPSVITQGPVNKLWRARILTNRAMSGLPKNGSLLPQVR